MENFNRTVPPPPSSRSVSAASSTNPQPAVASSIPTREEVVKFLEANVHRTFNSTTPEYNLILNVLQKYSPLFNTPNSRGPRTIEAFKITRTPQKKSLLLQAKFNTERDFISIPWTTIPSHINIINPSIPAVPSFPSHPSLNPTIPNINSSLNPNLNNPSYHLNTMAPPAFPVNNPINNLNLGSMNRGVPYPFPSQPVVDWFTKLTSAMRTAIYDQILLYKKRTFGVRKCSSCSMMTLLEVDHIIPFSFLRDRFLELVKKKAYPALNLPTLTIPIHFKWNGTGPIGGQWMFLDNDNDEYFKRAWQQFHAEEAKFQFLCERCNKDKSNKMP